MYKKNKTPKYRNTKVEYNGIKFDSKRERDRFIVLKDKEQQGVIQNLKLQPKYELIPAIKTIEEKALKTKTKLVTRTLQLPITYKGDFEYEKEGVVITEDVKPSKSLLPKEFSLKYKLFFWKYNRKIKLVFKPNEEV